MSVERLWLLLISALALSCGGPHKIATEDKSGPRPPIDPWVLTTLNAADPTPALLWNGLIGVRISRSGGGLDGQGHPLGFYMIDEYQPSGEEKLITLPNPLLVAWSVGNSLFSGERSASHDFFKSGGTPLDPRKGFEYRQSLDMRTGILTTQWKQDTPSAGRVSIRCDTAVHPAERILGQRWTLAASKDSSFAIRAVDYGGPGDDQRQVAYDPRTGNLVTSSASRAVTQHWSVQGADLKSLGLGVGWRVQEGTIEAGKRVTFERVLNFGAHSQRALPTLDESHLALLRKVVPEPASFNQLAAASKEIWAKRWQTDIEIEGPTEDQQAVRSWLFYLRSSMSPSGGMAISPFGLSSEKYGGHVFWDADLWVFPALCLIDPEAAQAIPAYRLRRGDVAHRAFREWLEAGRPTADGSLGITEESKPIQGVKFPWESSVSGRETCQAPSRFEDHVTGSVVVGLEEAAALGLAPQDQVELIRVGAVGFYDARATRSGYLPLHIRDVMSPDENHIGDDDLYTNLVAERVQSKGAWQEPPQEPFYLPRDGQSFLNYAGDPGRSYKQDAGLLAVYPLQYPPAEREAATMLQRFARKVIPNGPAMSDSLDALIEARIDSGQAYSTWEQSWRDFTGGPLLLFAEKRNLASTYFTTGAAGCLQGVLYGFLGFRLDSKAEPGAVWSTRLLGDNVLSVRPHLPVEWKSVKFKNFTVLGRRYTLTATTRGTTVTHGE